jgi:hypothetical protein
MGVSQPCPVPNVSHGYFVVRYTSRGYVGYDPTSRSQIGSMLYTRVSVGSSYRYYATGRTTPPDCTVAISDNHL